MKCSLADEWKRGRTRHEGTGKNRNDTITERREDGCNVRRKRGYGQMESARRAINGEWQTGESWVTGSGCSNSGNIVAFHLDKIVWRKSGSGERVFRGLERPGCA